MKSYENIGAMHKAVLYVAYVVIMLDLVIVLHKDLLHLFSHN